ncbi:MarR family winged helix-turn-helix transcriptional regulator [Paenibacillus sp. A14]|uniref:MarR family winged helix-turn-helix transcriptional regulator n=1 Tax=Paenibacillus sp. A14 TaxID=3119820 RepID=UPI002FE24400
MDKKQGSRSTGKEVITGSQLLGRLFMQLQKMDRQPRHYGDAGPLTPSEIHTIDAIGCGDGILMSELASRLGVTKGAVTQLIGRLVSKQLVRRSPHPQDSRAVLLSLTESGRNAYRAHERVHQSFYRSSVSN